MWFLQKVGPYVEVGTTLYFYTQSTRVQELSWELLPAFLSLKLLLEEKHEQVRLAGSVQVRISLHFNQMGDFVFDICLVF